MEALMEIMTEITNKYTSKESSSVTYERANLLMEGILYCMELGIKGEGEEISNPLSREREVYELGRHIVMEKTKKARAIYDNLIINFDDYGCINYKDTVLKGLPAFFLNYDPIFEPQNHILTLDYPSLHSFSKEEGVNLLLEYVTGISLEKYFLSYFNRNTIIHLLENVSKEYSALFLDNIAGLVLQNAIGCLIGGKPFDSLLLDHEVCDKISDYLMEDSMEEVEDKVKLAIHEIMKEINGERVEEYFMKASKEYAGSIYRGVKQHNLNNIFYASL